MFKQFQSQKRTCSLKSTIGAVFFWNYRLPNLIQYLFLWFSNLQCIAILLWVQLILLSGTEKDSFSDAIYTISNFFSLEKMIAVSSSITVIFLAWIYFFCIFLILTTILTRAHLRGKILKIQNYFTYILNQFHLAFGFWAVNIVLIPMFSTFNDEDELISFPDIQININTTVLKRINILVISMNYIITPIMATLSYDPLKSSNLFSVHTSVFQLLTFLFKATILLFMSNDIPSPFNYWGFVILSLLWSAYRHYKLVQKFPYYHYSPMKHSLLLSSAALLISCLNIFIATMKNFKQMSYLDVAYIEILLLPFTLKATHEHLNGVMQKSCSIKNKEIYSEDQIIKELFALTYLVENPKLTIHNNDIKKVNELHIWALWSQFCSNQEKVIKTIDLRKGNMYQQIQNTYINHIEEIIPTVLLNAVKVLKFNNKLKIILADHLSTLNAISPLAITSLLSMKKRKSLLQVEAKKILKTIEQKLHSSYQSKEGSVLDIKCYIDCQLIFRDLVKMILCNSKRVLDFWETYKKPEQKILNLYSKSQIIEQEDNKIRQYWSQAVQLDKTSASSLSVLYSRYLLLIRNAPYSARKIEKKVKLFRPEKNQAEEEITQIISRNTMLDTNNLIIYVSMSKESFGRIVDISPNISDIIGWKREDLVKNDISMLIPEFMRERHSQLMLRHIESIFTSSRLTQNIDTFVRAREGHVLPCYLYLCLYPYIQQELVYIGVVKPKKCRKFEQIIVNQKGILQAYTKGVQLHITDLSVRRTVDLSDSMKNLKEFFRLKSSFQTAESNVPIINVNFSSQIDEQSDRQTPKQSQGYFRLNSMKKSKRSWKRNNLIDRYFQNHNVNKSFYWFCDEKYVVLNLEKISNDTGSEPIVQEQDKSSKYKFSKYANEEDDTVPCKRSEKEAEEQYYPQKSLTPSNCLLYTKKSDNGSFMGTLPDTVKKTKRITFKEDEKRIAFPKHLAPEASEKVSVELEGKEENEKMIKSSSQNSSYNSYAMGLEKAFYTVPEDPKIRNLKYIFSGVIVIASALLCYFQVENDRTLTLMEGNIDILNNQTLELINILRLNQMMLSLILLNNQLMSFDRYSWANISDQRFIIQVQTGLLIDELNQQNIKLRNSLHKIDDNLRHKLYYKIPVIEEMSTGDYGSNRTISPFNLVSELVAAAHRITNRPFNEIKGDENDVLFIFKNTQNDVLAYGETAMEVITDDITQKLNNNTRLIISFTLLIGGMIVLLAGFLLSITKSIIEDRNKILDIFLRLEPRSLETHKVMIKRFCSILEQHSQDVHTLNGELCKNSFEKSKSQVAKSYNYKKRTSNTQGINNGIRKISIIIFCVCFLMLSGSLAVLGLVKKQNTQVSRKINIMVNTNFNLYNLWLIFSSFHEYIKDNTTTTLRGHPIKEEWETTFNRLSKTQEQFVTITDPELGIGPNPVLLEIIEGNLCQVFAPDEYAGTQCANMIYGIVQKGLIMLNSFMMSLVERIKSHFDSSAKTKEDQFEALNTTELIQSEPVMVLYLFPAYRMIGEVIKEHLDRDFKEFGIKIMQVITAFIVLFVIVGGVLCYRLKQALLNHKRSWRNLFRLVPSDMLVSNKLLQAYLLHSYGNIQGLDH